MLQGFRLASLPKDILYHAITPFLVKGDQYELLSTCKAWNLWLLETRTFHMSPELKLNENALLLYNRFVAKTIETCILMNTNDRKLKLTFVIDALFTNHRAISYMANHCYQIVLLDAVSGTDYDDTSYKRYYLPKRFENPTAECVQRWFQSAWIDYENKDDYIEAINQHVAKFNSNTKESNYVCNRLQDLKGVNMVVLKQDKKCYVELGKNENVRLQAIRFDCCSSVADIPMVPSITLINCPNVSQLDLCSRAEHVHLEGMTIADLRMLGGVKQLVLKNCKVTYYPVPTIGKGQAWEFNNVDIKNLSCLQSLEKLSLKNCTTYRLNLKKLGAIRYLMIENCKTYILPMAIGWLQELSIGLLDIRGNDWCRKTPLYMLTLDRCTVDLSVFSVKNIKHLHCKDVTMDNMANFNLYLLDGIPRHTNLSILQSAVDMWCSNQEQAISIYGDISEWDVSKVTDMGKLFFGKQSFNSNIDTWDMRNVTQASNMFHRAASFNQPLNAWDVSNVTNMKYMFNGATSFNQPLDSWDVGNVTNMKYMFNGATSFNQPLNAWDVGNVTDMSEMFPGATSFNQPLNAWDVGNVTNMKYMFYEASSFNQPLSSWDVSNVTDMEGMFHGTTTCYNQPLSSWDVSNVTNMKYMFLEQPLSTNH